MRSLVKAFWMVAVLASASGSAALAQSDDIGLPVGSAPPTTIQVEDLNGQPVDLGSYVGKKPMLIEFWATWCPLCRALLPKIEAAVKRAVGR